MTPFLRDLLLFASIQMAILIGLQIRLARQSDSYLAANLDKERRLATLDGPRIVFVGGSNCAFGLDGGVIEERLGRSPINMGQFAPFGGVFMLKQAYAGLRDGDVVVVSMEYEHFCLPDFYRGLDCRSWRELLMLNPWAVRHLSWANCAQLTRDENALACFSELVKRSVPDPGPRRGRTPRPSRPAFYTRAACNEYGDVAVPRGHAPAYQKHAAEASPLCVVPEHLEQVTRDLNEFHARCSQRGIRVFVAMPCIPESRHAQEGDDCRAMEAYLRAHGAATVLAGVDDGLMPDALFFDSVYHLTTHGARVRSHLLCDRLEAALR